MTPTPQHPALDCAAKQALTAAKILPSTFRAAVTRLEDEPQHYQRAAHVIDTRRVRLGCATAKGTRKSELTARPDPRRVDPWQVDPGALAGQTRTVAVCPGCEGGKKTTCASCAGGTTISCSTCGGGGRVAGQRGPKNCPACRGKGFKRCPSCKGKGQVKCVACEGLGRVQAWLEIEAERSVRVLAHPSAGLAQLHAELDLAQDFDREPSHYPVPLESDSGWVTPLPAGTAPELLASVDPVTDRVVQSRVQRFGATVHHCHYALSTGAGDVQVAGHPPRVLPSSQWGPWRRRRAVSLVAGGTILVLALGTAIAFGSRAQWYAHQPSLGLIPLLGFISALFSVVAVAGFTLPKPARTWLRFRVPAILAAAPWVWILLLWATVHPTAEGIRASIHAGELADARREIDAIEDDSDDLRAARGQLEQAEAEAEHQRRVALDDDHLQRVVSASSTAAAAEQLEAPWELEPNRQQAVEKLLGHADEEMQALHAQHDGNGLRGLASTVEPYDPARALRIRARAVLADVVVCERRSDFACIARTLADAKALKPDPEDQAALDQAKTRASERLDLRLRDASVDRKAPASDQQQQLQALLDDAKSYRDLTGEAPPIEVDPLEQRLATVTRTIERAQAKEAEARRKAVERAEAEQARRAKQEQRRAERERRRAERAARPKPKTSYSPPVERTCCKYCSTGKPCGNTCIARNRTCHAGRGCAC